MSDTPKSKTKSPETATKTDTSAATDSTAASTSKSEAGKSSRESVGGSGAVHYGFFSNVKTPQYRSGWDDIWNKKTSSKKKKPARAKEPVVVSLSLEDLPAEMQQGLADIARARLKKSRINYDKRAKAGSVTWRIECEVKR